MEQNIVSNGGSLEDSINQENIPQSFLTVGRVVRGLFYVTVLTAAYLLTSCAGNKPDPFEIKKQKVHQELRRKAAEKEQEILRKRQAHLDDLLYDDSLKYEGNSVEGYRRINSKRKFLKSRMNYLRGWKKYMRRIEVGFVATPPKMDELTKILETGVLDRDSLTKTFMRELTPAIKAPLLYEANNRLEKIEEERRAWIDSIFDNHLIPKELLNSPIIRNSRKKSSTHRYSQEVYDLLNIAFFRQSYITSLVRLGVEDPEYAKKMTLPHLRISTIRTLKNKELQQDLVKEEEIEILNRMSTLSSDTKLTKSIGLLADLHEDNKLYRELADIIFMGHEDIKGPYDMRYELVSKLGLSVYENELIAQKIDTLINSGHEKKEVENMYLKGINDKVLYDEAVNERGRWEFYCALLDQLGETCKEVGLKTAKGIRDYILKKIGARSEDRLLARKKRQEILKAGYSQGEIALLRIKGLEDYEIQQRINSTIDEENFQHWFEGDSVNTYIRLKFMEHRRKKGTPESKLSNYGHNELVRYGKDIIWKKEKWKYYMRHIGTPKIKPHQYQKK